MTEHRDTLLQRRQRLTRLAETERLAIDRQQSLRAVLVILAYALIALAVARLLRPLGHVLWQSFRAWLEPQSLTPLDGIFSLCCLGFLIAFALYEGLELQRAWIAGARDRILENIDE